MARQFSWSVKRIMWSNNIVKMFHEAATKIQKLIIHRQRKRHMAATKIQALFRGWHYRMKVIMARRDEQRRIALEELDARNKMIYDFKMRVIRAKNMAIWWCATKVRGSEEYSKLLLHCANVWSCLGRC